MTRRFLRLAAPALLGATCLIGAGTAQAATNVSVSNGKLTITGGAESNNISAYSLPNEGPGSFPPSSSDVEVIVVHDGDEDTAAPGLADDIVEGLTLPGPGCTSEDANTLKCTHDDFTAVEVRLGGGDDSFFEFIGTDGSGRSTSALGEQGAITFLALGEADADRIFGTVGNDTLDGGAGDDDLRGGNGNDLLKPGADTNQSRGGGGTDTVDYSDQAAGRAISLNNEPDDGANCNLDEVSPGANCADENVRSDIENITTGSGPDLISASAGVNTIITGEGDDVIFGGGGADTINGGNGANTVHGDTGTYRTQRTSGGNPVDVALPEDGGDPGADGITTGTGADTIKGGSEQETDLFGTPIAGDTINAGNGDNTIAGEAGNESITAGTGKDIVSGGTGNDSIVANGGELQVLTGGTGNDSISSGDGSDNADGGSGADTITAGGGNGQTLTGGPGVDSITSGDGSDNVDGGTENDTISSGAGANQLVGGTGNDSITATGGVDTADGGTGNDTINIGDGDNQTAIGGGGNDEIRTGSGKDTINAGSGEDKVAGGNGNNVIDLGSESDGVIAGQSTAGAGQDTIIGGTGNDTITDGGGDNPRVEGGDGSDAITTGGGHDNVYGGIKNVDSAGDANDTINTAGGDDQVVGARGADFMDVGAGSDTISYEEKTDPVYAVVVSSNTQGSGTFCDPMGPQGNCENDTIKNAESLFGGSAGDILAGDDLTHASGADRKCVTPAQNDFQTTLRGNDGNDQLFGCANADSIFGGRGDDILVGGAGGDTIEGGSDGETNGDSVSYQDSAAGVTVTLGDGVANDGAPGENDNLNHDIENVTGSDFDDALTGSSQRNTLTGLSGDDDLDGGFGPDGLDGGNGRDEVSYPGRTGNLTVTLDGAPGDGEPGENDDVDTSVEDLIGAGGNDTFVGQPGGNPVGNRFVGNGGNDSLDGKQGADEFVGGEVGGDDSSGTEDTVVYSERGATEVVEASINDQPSSGSEFDENSQGQRDLIHQDIENLAGGGEINHFEGDSSDNDISGGGGNDVLEGAQGTDRVVGGTGDDSLDGGAGIDSLQPGLGNDSVAGAGGTDTVDYSERTTPVVVSFDNIANDGEIAIGEQDNVKTDVEECTGCGAQLGGGGTGGGTGGDTGGGTGGDTGGGTGGDTGGSTGGDTGGSTGGDTGGGTTPLTGGTETSPRQSDENTDTTVTTTTTPGEDTTPAQNSTIQSTAKGVRKGKKRSLLVSGRVLVKARSGIAKGARSCAGGGKVRIKITKAGKVVGKRTAKVTKTCKFRVPVKLAEGTTGKVKVKVTFLGNRTLKRSTRTSILKLKG